MNLLEALAAALKTTVDQLPTGQPWSERMESRIAQIAETYDPETRTHQPLRKRTR